MGNYMIHLMNHCGLKSKYYCPRDPINHIHILHHHVCCLYVIRIANMLCGNISILQMHSASEYFDTVGPVKESMPQYTFKGLLECMYFSDDWDEDRGDGIQSIRT